MQALTSGDGGDGGGNGGDANSALVVVAVTCASLLLVAVGVAVHCARKRKQLARQSRTGGPMPFAVPRMGSRTGVDALECPVVVVPGSWVESPAAPVHLESTTASSAAVEMGDLPTYSSFSHREEEKEDVGPMTKI